MEHSNSHGSGEGHGSVKSYLLGFLFALVLTGLSFAVGMEHMFSREMTVLVLAVLALVQVLVHLTFFLHMNGSSQQRWNVTAFAITIFISVIVIGGTVWIMYDSNKHMMMTS